jgi:hypothetical protein
VVQAADVPVAQPVEDEFDEFPAAATLPMLVPRRWAIWSRTRPRRVCLSVRWMASTAAQRTSREPCLVIRPRCTVVSDSWCLGVSPAQLASCAARRNRLTSPISATNTAARIGPTPEIAWMAV